MGGGFTRRLFLSALHLIAPLVICPPQQLMKPP